MSHQSIMSFLLVNKPAERIKNNYLIKGEIWKKDEIDTVKDINVLIDTDLYLDVYSKYLQYKDILEESHFCCPVLEDFHTIEQEDTFEMLGGSMHGITIDGEYLNMGMIN